MRFASLGSGSRGNATLIEVGQTRLLLDNGFAARETELRLAALEVEPDSIDAILVTHEHQDHIRGVGAFSRRYRLPVYMTHGTHRQNRCGELADLHLIHGHQPAFSIGDFEVQPFTVPHDASEPVQYLFRSAKAALGILTDAGMATPHIMQVLSASDALFLECNHDLQMLASGPYPPALQRRVGGLHGHLSNDQAAEILGNLDHARLRHIVVAHLSEKNNSPERAKQTLLDAVPGIEDRLAFTCQDRVCGWFEL